MSLDRQLFFSSWSYCDEGEESAITKQFEPVEKKLTTTNDQNYFQTAGKRAKQGQVSWPSNLGNVDKIGRILQSDWAMKVALSPPCYAEFYAER